MSWDQSLIHQERDLENHQFCLACAWLSTKWSVVSFSKYNHTDIYLVVIWLVFLYCISHIFLIKSSSWRSTEINVKTSLYLNWSMNSFWKENTVCTSVFEVIETIVFLVSNSLQFYFFSWSLPDIFSVGTGLLVQTNLPYIFFNKKSIFCQYLRIFLHMATNKMSDNL